MSPTKSLLDYLAKLQLCIPTLPKTVFRASCGQRASAGITASMPSRGDQMPTLFDRGNPDRLSCHNGAIIRGIVCGDLRDLYYRDNSATKYRKRRLFDGGH